MALSHTPLTSCPFSSSSRPFFSQNTSRRPGSTVIWSTNSRNNSSSYASRMAGRLRKTLIRYSVWDISHSKAFCPCSCRSRLRCASSCASIWFCLSIKWQSLCCLRLIPCPACSPAALVPGYSVLSPASPGPALGYLGLPSAPQAWGSGFPHSCWQAGSRA